MKRKLEQLNEAAADTLRDHLRAAVDNVVAGMRCASPSVRVRAPLSSYSLSALLAGTTGCRPTGPGSRR